MSIDHETRINAAIVGIVAVVSGALLTWSARYCGEQNADSLLFAIISVTKITPYYWGQNRVGSVLPFLTAWISDIHANLMAQVFMRAVAASALPLLVIAILRPHAPSPLTFGLSLALLLVTLTGDATRLLWISGLPYAVSGVILGAAIWLIDTRGGWWSWAAVLVLLLLALFVNLSLVLFAVPLFALLAVLRPSGRHFFAAVLLVCAFILVWAHAKYIGGSEYAQFSWSLAHTRTGWLNAFRNLGFWAPPFGIALVAAFFIRRKVSAIALAIVIAASVAIFVTANSDWPIANGLRPRYFVFYAAILVLLAGVVIAEAGWVARRWARAAVFAGVALALGTSAAVAVRLTSTCPAHRPDIAEAVGIATRNASLFDVVLVGGNYWLTWPAVFELIADGRQAFGLSLRGFTIGDLVREKAEAASRVGLICFDEIASCANQYAQTSGMMFGGRPIHAAIESVTEGRMADGRPYSVSRITMK